MTELQWRDTEFGDKVADLGDGQFKVQLKSSGVLRVDKVSFFCITILNGLHNLLKTSAEAGKIIFDEKSREEIANTYLSLLEGREKATKEGEILTKDDLNKAVSHKDLTFKEGEKRGIPLTHWVALDRGRCEAILENMESVKKAIPHEGVI